MLSIYIDTLNKSVQSYLNKPLEVAKLPNTNECPEIQSAITSMVDV